MLESGLITNGFDLADRANERKYKDGLEELSATWTQTLVAKAKEQFVDFALVADEKALIAYLKEVHVRYFIELHEEFPEEGDATYDDLVRTFKSATDKYKLDMDSYFTSIDNFDEIKTLAEQNKARLAVTNEGDFDRPKQKRQEFAVSPPQNLIQQSNDSGIPQWMADDDKQ